jgi:2'-5' RNA ligase
VNLQENPAPAHEETTKGPRLFIAIPLPDAIRRQVAELSANLQKGFQFTPNRPSWSNPEAIHLTLIFLGETPAGMVEPISRILDEVAADFEQLRIEVKRLGVFPHWRHPKVLWAGIRDRSHQVEPLHQALEKRLVQLGFRPEEKEFHPHLTLARFKYLKGVAAVESVVNSHQSFKFGPFHAPEMVLYQSRLHPLGAIHTPLHRAALKPPTRPEMPEEDEK